MDDAEITKLCGAKILMVEYHPGYRNEFTLLLDNGNYMKLHVVEYDAANNLKNMMEKRVEYLEKQLNDLALDMKEVSDKIRDYKRFLERAETL